MYISHIAIKNFRCFKELEADLQQYCVVVGANKAGKSNFIEAIKLAISPYIDRNGRTLNKTDFWMSGKGDQRIEEELSISIELTLADEEEKLFSAALIRSHVAQFTYVFRRKTIQFQLEIVAGENADIVDDSADGDSEQEESKADGTEPVSDVEYESLWRMGTRKTDVTKNYISQRLSFEVLAALRDAEDVLARWTKSPLRPLLQSATAEDDLDGLTRAIRALAGELRSKSEGVKKLVSNLNTRGKSMVGSIFTMNSELNFELLPKGNDDLLRYMQLYVDGNLPITRTSLGTQNVLYLTLLLETIQQKQTEDQQLILALEEPEAHVHPHVQRSIFRYFREQKDFVKSLIITTHSPHISSVSPLKSIFILREGGSEFGSRADYLRDEFTARDIQDLERYLDVTRAELIFSRGVIFVEGIAEQYLIPAFASTLDINLDHLGVSIVPIHSTNFKPYVRLVLPRNLNIPFAVLTDGDATVKRTGLRGLARGRELAKLVSPESTDTFNIADLEAVGIFVGNYTLETDLVPYCTEEMIRTYREFDAGRIADEFEEKLREIASKTSLNKTDAEYPANRIEKRISKGRYAQRLASEIEASHDAALCPSYIRSCLLYLIKQLPNPVLEEVVEQTTEDGEL